MPVNADRNNMSQVVIILVMNALDAMNKKGTLTLKTYREDRQKKDAWKYQIPEPASLRRTCPGYSIRFLRPRNRVKGPGWD